MSFSLIAVGNQTGRQGCRPLRIPKDNFSNTLKFQILKQAILLYILPQLLTLSHKKQALRQTAEPVTLKVVYN